MQVTLLNLAKDGLGPIFRQNNKYNAIKCLKKEKVINPTLCLIYIYGIYRHTHTKAKVHSTG